MLSFLIFSPMEAEHEAQHSDQYLTKTTATKQHPGDFVGSSCKGNATAVTSSTSLVFLGLSIRRAMPQIPNVYIQLVCGELWGEKNKNIKKHRVIRHVTPPWWLEAQDEDAFIISCPGKKLSHCIDWEQPLVNHYKSEDIQVWKHEDLLMEILKPQTGTVDPFMMSTLNSCCWALFKW